jgi:2-phospho-L-lactate guanylyltransferase
LSVWAVVPVKETMAAKQRLAGTVPAHLRPAFALTMLEDVLSALAPARGLAGIIVVTLDPAAGAIAQRYSARILTDGARDGHTGSVTAAAQRLQAEGMSAILELPADIPLVTTDEISRLIAAHREAPSFTIAPSHDERGSNAVLISPPTAVPLAFGDDSFYPHLQAARDHGIEPTIVRAPGIALDIDRPEDLRAFAQQRSDTRTQAFLDQHGLALQSSGAAA